MEPVPTFHRVLLKDISDDGGLILVGGLGMTRKGVVISKGDMCRYVEVADVVAYVDDDAVTFRYRGETLYLINEEDVLAILDRSGVEARR